MTAQTSFLPRIGAPLRVLTEKQIADEQKLFLETRYNIAHRARTLGVKRATLDYHLRPVSGNRLRIGPRVQALIDAGDDILALAPKDETGWKARLAWAQAKQAITRRKRET